MRRALGAAALLAVSVAVGAWLFAPRVPAGGPAPATSATSGKDEVANRERPRTRESTTGKVPPASHEAAPADSPTPVAPVGAGTDAKQLREEADRLIAERRIPEAIDALRKATAADPSARNHGDLGRLLAGVMALDEALVHLRKAAELDSGNADRWIELANAYYRKVDLGKAWEAERRAKQAEPGLVLGRDASGMRVRGSDSPRPNP